jgi:hypothetical protein
MHMETTQQPDGNHKLTPRTCNPARIAWDGREPLTTQQQKTSVPVHGDNITNPINRIMIRCSKIHGKKHMTNSDDGKLTPKQLWEGLKIIPNFHTSLRRKKVGRQFRTQTLAHMLWKYGVWTVAVPAGLGLTMIAPFALLITFPLALAIDSAGSRILDPIFLPKGKRRYTIIEVDKKRSGQTTKIQYNDGTIAWQS